MAAILLYIVNLICSPEPKPSEPVDLKAIEEVFKIKNQVRCLKGYDGCNMFEIVHEDVVKYTTFNNCWFYSKPRCIKYECDDTEFDVYQNLERFEALPYCFQVRSTPICGVPYEFNRRFACECKPQYKWRDNKTLKCIKTCP